MVIYGDLWWFMVIYGDLLYFTMVFQHVPRYLRGVSSLQCERSKRSPPASPDEVPAANFNSQARYVRRAHVRRMWNMINHWNMCIIYIYICMYVCMHACMYVRMYVCTYVCICICMYMYVYVCICMYMYVWMINYSDQPCMNFNIYIYMCVCLYGHMYIYIIIYIGRTSSWKG